MQPNPDHLIVRVEGDHRTGKVRVWINGQDVSRWINNDVQIKAQNGFLPEITLTLLPDRLWYETVKHDDEGPPS